MNKIFATIEENVSNLLVENVIYILIHNICYCIITLIQIQIIL